MSPSTVASEVRIKYYNPHTVRARGVKPVRGDAGSDPDSKTPTYQSRSACCACSITCLTPRGDDHPPAAVVARSFNGCRCGREAGRRDEGIW